jgi:hypothetical protein
MMLIRNNLKYDRILGYKNSFIHRFIAGFWNN